MIIELRHNDLEERVGAIVDGALSTAWLIPCRDRWDMFIAWWRAIASAINHATRPAIVRVAPRQMHGTPIAWSDEESQRVNAAIDHFDEFGTWPQWSRE